MLMEQSDEEIKQQIAKIEKEIDNLKVKKLLKDSKCAICGKDNCDVISFTLKKPVHSSCHELSKPNT